MFNYAKRFKSLRDEYRISARKLSQAINVSATTISGIENSKAYPSVQLINSICEFFDITHEEFFSNSSNQKNDKKQVPEPTHYSEKAKELIILYDKASDEDKAVIDLILMKYNKEKSDNKNCLVKKA